MLHTATHGLCGPGNGALPARLERLPARLERLEVTPELFGVGDYTMEVTRMEFVERSGEALAEGATESTEAEDSATARPC